jgi:Spy/CpxP family protein refolding chaperone
MLCLTALQESSMAVRKNNLARRNARRMALAAGALLTVATMSANADPNDRCGSPQEFHEPPGPPGPPPPDREGPGEFGFDRPPPYLRDVDLADDQADRVFAIVHAAAPGLREQAKAVFRARESLRDLAQSSAYSDEAAATIAEAGVQAETQLSLQRARRDHDIYALLTPEQRAKIKDHDREHEPHPGAGPWRP